MAVNVAQRDCSRAVHPSRSARISILSIEIETDFHYDKAARIHCLSYHLATPQSKLYLLGRLINNNNLYKKIYCRKKYLICVFGHVYILLAYLIEFFILITMVVLKNFRLH